MNYSMKIEVNQKLKLNMTMSLQQSIKLLEMNVIDLNNFIYKKALENPLIEIKDGNTELKIEDYIRKNKRSNLDTDINYERLQIEEDEESLIEHIRKQVDMLDIDKETFESIFVIVDNLNRNGYLEIDLEEISKIYGKKKENLEKSLTILQKLDPIGLGGKNFVDTLLLQTKDDDLLKKIISEHLEDVYKKNYKKIIKELKIDKNLLQKKINDLKELNPKPALTYNLDRNTKFAIPEARIEISGDIVEVVLNDYLVPNIVLSKYYKTYLDTDNEETKTYVKNMKNEYNWLKNSLEIRKNTLYKVLNEIIKIQYKYFISGEKYLVSISQKDLANKLNISESTVSRIVNNKYIETERGILNLKYFFYSNNTNSISDKAIKSLIKDLIDEENKEKPLSDNRIKELMEEKNVKIARRTVTKYREILGIENSTRRKELS